uniref:MFS domain-containing protein n=1 Tax=Syphacia muris TaxID=451379 RepID=A0A0N5AM90_9BILA
MAVNEKCLKKPATLPARLLHPIYRFSNETLAVVCLLSMLFNAGFFLQLMMMPYIGKQLGVTIGQLGFAQSVVGLLQVIGSFISGFIATKYSTQWSLRLCYISAILSQIITFFAKDAKMLYIGLVPQIFMNGQQCDMTMLTRLTKPGKERTEAFSKIGLMLGIGFLLSTALSISAIKTLGEKSVLIVAAVLSIIELILFNNYVADHLDTENKSDEGKEENKKKLNLNILVNLCSKKQILSTYICKALLFGSSMFTMTIIQIYLINSYNISPTISSLIQAYFGLLLMLSSGLAIPTFRKLYNEDQLFMLGAILLFFANALLIKAASLWLILFLTIFLCVGMSLVATIADSIVTGAVDKKDEEIVISIIISTDTLIRALAPGISGYLLENYGISIFGIIGGTFAVIVIIKDFSKLITLALKYFN